VTMATKKRSSRSSRRPPWVQRVPIAEAATSHGGVAYAARQYPEAAGTYSGATDLTEYFRRVNVQGGPGGEWVPIGWTSVPKTAYRRLRALLKESRVLRARRRGR
jgi:hypothetical protein